MAGLRPNEVVEGPSEFQVLQEGLTGGLSALLLGQIEP